MVRRFSVGIMNGHNRGNFQAAFRVLLFSAAFLWALSTQAKTLEHDLLIKAPASSGKFERLQEPSGVAVLDANTLMVVEDEAGSPLTRLAFSSTDPEPFHFQEIEQLTSASFVQRMLLAPMDDLEGIARLSDERFFVIGSHENASRGKSPAREKLVLFTRTGYDITSAQVRKDLFDQLQTQYPELSAIVHGSKKGSKKALNIEGLAYDRKRQNLLIGLRTPQIEDNAIIVTLTNAAAFMQGEDARFKDALTLIDLNKGGIRAMTYDDQSDTLMLISKRESGGSDRSTLWTLALEPNARPVRYRSKNRDLFDNVEGLSAVGDGFFFVRDDGGRYRKGRDAWFLLTRSQLGLTPH